ncbi:DUF742 domain-containing protein [Streptomyces macrosporus]|uniref:DUF742 domain-containing protein n=1 Tax=Streptomyces macrosporus TaxID=44032 RepID=A0ABN3K2G7_9ACTN
MSHWTDHLESDDAEDSLVRPYTITRGRTAPQRDDLTLITVVTTVEPEDGRAAARRLEPEHRAILEQCRTPAAVAEIAAELDLPVSVTKILIGDLVSLGRVTIRPPLAAEQRGGLNVELLQAVRDGLQRL